MAKKNKPDPKKGVTLVKVDPETITDKEIDEILDTVLGPDDGEDEDKDEEES